MHKSVILGIIGSCLAAVSGVGMILAGILMGSMFSSTFFSGTMPDAMFSDMFTRMFSNMSVVYIIIGGIAIASVVPGVAGCILFKNNRKTAGILFIVAACLSMLTAIAAGVLLLLAGIFALSKDKPANQPLMAAPPPPSYRAPYPPPAYGSYPPPTAPPYPPYGSQPVPPPYPPYGSQPVPPPYPPYGSQPVPPPYPPYGSQPVPPPYPPYGSQSVPPNEPKATPAQPVPPSDNNGNGEN